MSASLNDLLPAVKRSIMSYLPLKDRKNMRLVNHSWSDAFILTKHDIIIIRNHRKLPTLKLTCPNIEIYCSRPTSALENGMDGWIPPSADTWKMDGRKVRYLKIWRYCTSNNKQFEEIIRFFCNLETLDIARKSQWCKCGRDACFYEYLTPNVSDAIISCERLRNFYCNLSYNNQENDYLRKLICKRGIQLKELFLQNDFGNVNKEPHDILLQPFVGPQLTGFLMPCDINALKSIPDFFPNMKKIDLIYIWNIQLARTLPEILEGLMEINPTHIRVQDKIFFSFIHNPEGLEFLNPDKFSALVALDLVLLTDMTPPGIPQMPNLEDLRLKSSYHLQNVPLRILEKAPALRTLSLKSVDPILLEAICQMGNLRHLHIGEIRVLDLPLLNNLTELLQLSCQVVKKIGRGTLNLPNLETLHLPYVARTCISRLTTNCPNLSDLFLSRYNIVKAFHYDVTPLLPLNFNLHVGDLGYCMRHIFKTRRLMINAEEASSNHSIANVVSYPRGQTHGISYIS